MYISKKVTVIMVSAVLMLGMAVGFFMTQDYTQNALAHNDKDSKDNVKVDRETLSALYEAAFGRPLDAESDFHIGKDLKQVLKDINGSQERRYYVALFKAVKSYEEAIRAPGQLNDTDKKQYLDTIDTALSTLLAWVETLPERKDCKLVVDPIAAYKAIIEAYEKMSPEAQNAARKGIFMALNNINPHNMKLPKSRCFVTPMPTISPTATPSPTVSPTPIVTPTPTVTPTPSPTVTPTPTPTITPSPTVTPTPTP